jgi:hypothetical protein
MDQLRFLQQLGSELAWRGVPGFRVQRRGPRGRLPLHRELGHLGVKLYRTGKLKVEICCDGANPSTAMSMLTPICHELEACMGQPGREERFDGVRRIRWTFYRYVHPGSERDAGHWAADFLEAGWRRMARHRREAEDFRAWSGP